MYERGEGNSPLYFFGSKKIEEYQRIFYNEGYKKNKANEQKVYSVSIARAEKSVNSQINGPTKGFSCKEVHAIVFLYVLSLILDQLLFYTDLSLFFILLLKKKKVVACLECMTLGAYMREANTQR